MSKTAAVLITAAVTAIATSLFWIAGIFVAVSYFGDAAPFSVTVNAPDSVKVGQEFTICVVTRNVGTEASVLGSIDLDEAFAGGFEVVKVSPFPREVMNSFDLRSHYFTLNLAPDEEVSVTFTMRALNSGVWTGQIDSCTPSEKFASANISIRVDE